VNGTPHYVGEQNYVILPNPLAHLRRN
jgi:hypothetical protein